MRITKRLLSFLLIFTLVVLSAISVSALDVKQGGKTAEEQKAFNILSSMETPVPEIGQAKFLNEIEFLSEKGFTESEITTLDYDISQVANLIRTQNMNDAEIAVLKNGFLSDRTPMITRSASDGLTAEESGMPDPTAVRRGANKDTGVHFGLFTQASNKFYEYTGFVKLGQAYVPKNNVQHTVPYAMFGAHGTGGDIDAGVAYYSDDSTWRLGSYANGNWNNGEKNAKFAQGSKLYLDFKCHDQKATLLIRDPVKWTVLDQLTVNMGSGYITNPSDLELVRENTLAQNKRGDDGSYLKNVGWHDVYLYSLTQTTLASQKHMKSSRSGFFSYYGRYLYGETRDANKYITADKSQLYYNSEVSSLSF